MVAVVRVVTEPRRVSTQKPDKPNAVAADLDVRVFVIEKHPAGVLDRCLEVRELCGVKLVLVIADRVVHWGDLTQPAHECGKALDILGVCVPAEHIADAEYRIGLLLRNEAYEALVILTVFLAVQVAYRNDPTRRFYPRQCLGVVCGFYGNAAHDGRDRRRYKADAEYDKQYRHNSFES